MAKRSRLGERKEKTPISPAQRTRVILDRIENLEGEEGRLDTLLYICVGLPLDDAFRVAFIRLVDVGMIAKRILKLQEEFEKKIC